LFSNNDQFLNVGDIKTITKIHEKKLQRGEGLL